MLNTTELKFGIMLHMEFTEWLDEELEKRRWNHSELARRINMTEASISHIFTNNESHKRKPGVNMCRAIARAFEMNEIDVFQKADLIEPITYESPFQNEFDYVISNMDEDEQLVYLDQGRLILEQRKRRQKKKGRQQISSDMG